MRFPIRLLTATLLASPAGFGFGQSPQPVSPQPTTPQPTIPQPVQVQPTRPQPTTPQPGTPQPGQPMTGSGQPGQQPVTGFQQPGQPRTGSGQPGQRPATGFPQPGQPRTGSGQPGQQPPTGLPQPGLPRTGTGQPGQRPPTGLQTPGRPLPGQLPPAGTQQQPIIGSGSFQAGSGQVYRPPTQLFIDPSVRQHLRIDDTQVNRLNEANATILQRYRPQIAQLGNINDAQAQARALQLNQAMSQDFLKSAGAILTPEQMGRYRQIELQRLGTVAAFGTPSVQQRLGFDQRQLERFQKLQQDYTQKLTALYPDLMANRPNAYHRLSALRAEFNQQWQSVLTPEQRRMWDDMLGTPFDFQYQPSVIRFGN